MSRQLAKYWISVDEYERMGEAGILRPDARLELLEGAIYEMSSIGSRHAACVDAFALLLIQLAGRRFRVRTQSPIRLDDYSESQPDVALLRWRDDFYREAHPTPTDGHAQHHHQQFRAVYQSTERRRGRTPRQQRRH